MPLDDTLGDLAQQQPPQQPRGLPPPQPTPYGIARAQQHQQQWAMPPVNEQLGDIAAKTVQTPGNILYGANQWIGDRMQTAMQGVGRVDDEESVRAATDLASLLFGSGIGGAEAGAAGVAGGRLYLKQIPGISSHSAFDAKNLQLIDEAGKVLGDVRAHRVPNDRTLHVDWAGSEEGPWSGGVSEMLSFMNELQHEFPGIEKIRAQRTSGARHGPAADIEGAGGAREIPIPKHRRVAPGTPRDPPPAFGTKAPITEAREQQWRERNPIKRMFTARTRRAEALRPPPPVPMTEAERLNPQAAQAQSNALLQLQRQQREADELAFIERILGRGL